jgi:hypothetical protein
MQKRFVLFLLLLCLSINGWAQKDTCYLGIYINKIYDFKIEDKSYMADFWMWVNYKNDSLKFENGIEITNSKATDFSHFTIEKKAGWNWASQKCKAEITQQWDLSKFPFDKQVLKIQIENTQYDISTVIYKADTINSKLDSGINSLEWCVNSFSIKENTRTYATTYGNPALSGKSAYAGVMAEIVIERKNSWIKLMKMLTGAYVAFLISVLVFFISSENQDSRYGLCVGGLFTAIGNKYIVESSVPSSTGNTLMDNVHNLTFIFILLIVAVVTVSLHFFEAGDELKRKKSFAIDKISAATISLLYILLNAIMIYNASR